MRAGFSRFLTRYGAANGCRWCWILGAVGDFSDLKTVQFLKNGASTPPFLYLDKRSSSDHVAAQTTATGTKKREARTRKIEGNLDGKNLGEQPHENKKRETPTRKNEENLDEKILGEQPHGNKKRRCAMTSQGDLSWKSHGKKKAQFGNWIRELSSRIGLEIEFGKWARKLSSRS